MELFNKKGQIDGLANLLTALGTIAILAAVIFLIIAETKDQAVDMNPCHNTSNWYNATGNVCHDNATGDITPGGGLSYTMNATIEVQEATNDIPGWFAIVVIVVIGGVLLGLIQWFRRG